MNVSFLYPIGALIGLAVLIPLAALLLRERRMRGTRRALTLEPPPRLAFMPAIAAWILAFGLLAAAAAQPVMRVDSTVTRRTDAEAFVVFDTTRSMLASRAPAAATRMQRALEAATEIRAALPGIPVGVGSLTNRPLPHLFPTTDEQAFDQVVRQSIGVNRPPGSETGLFNVATDFQSLEALASTNWYRPASVKRLAILLTDGESSTFAIRTLVSRLSKGGIELVVVRFWNASERVWQPNGSAEPLYRPQPLALPQVAELAARTTGGRVYDETELAAAAGASLRYLGNGPAVAAAAGGRTVSLAPYAVLVACIPLALLLLPSLVPRRVALGGRRSKGVLSRIAYSMVSAWRGSSTTAERR